VAGDHVAVDALAFLGEPLDEGGGVAHLAARLGERLALLAGHQHGEVFLVGEDELEPAPQDLRARAGGQRAPRRPRRVGGLDGAPGLGRAHARDGAEHLAVGRVADAHGGAVVGVDPLPVDVAAGAEEVGIFQVQAHGRVPSGGRGKA
jgi:hypothetical protein